PCSGDPPHLHPFPTRRSSDLPRRRRSSRRRPGAPDRPPRAVRVPGTRRPGRPRPRARVAALRQRIRSWGGGAFEGWSGGRGGGPQDGREQAEPVVRRAGEGVDGMLGVRHQPDHPPVVGGDARDVGHGTVGVAARVPEHHPVLGLELFQGGGVGDVAALPRLERHEQLLPDREPARPRRGGGLDAQPLVAADEVQPGVAHERARQQPRLAGDLEAVADAEDRGAPAGRRDDLRHDRRDARDGACAQVVAVGEPAGHDDRVHALEVVVGVPEGHRLRTRVAHRPGRVDVVERAGERDDPDPHALVTTQSSITGLASRVAATRSRVSSSTVSSTSSTKCLPCRTSVTPETPSRVSAPATAWPCGSRISGFGITSTTTFATPPAYGRASARPAVTPLPPDGGTPPRGGSRPGRRRRAVAEWVAVRITHFGHSCLLLATGSARILFAPGSFSTGFESVRGLDAVLITHQHFDHLDADRIRPLLDANPDARLIVDAGTAEQLGEVPHEVTAPGARLQIGGARVDVLGGDHAVIHPDIPIVPNNAYLDDGTPLPPGDSYTPPPSPVDVLFLPTGAPWLKLSEAVDYLRAVAPRTAVPIHEAVLSRPAMHYGFFERLGPEKTTIKVLDRETATEV